MATLAVELSDVGIRVKRTDEPAGRGPSPGYALIDGPRLITGNDAFNSARLHPTRINHRFWSELNDAPLRAPGNGGVSHADMAHAQLEQIWRECGAGVDAVLLAIPGFFSTESLGLLLGIARACGMPVTGMVDLAVAGAAGHVELESALHVDLHLHRVVVTVIGGGTTVERGRVELGDRAGLVPLRRTWIKQIAQAFVSQTRFDPLHSATTEQALFDRLTDWLERLESDRLSVFEIKIGDRVHSAELDREELARAVAPDYDEIIGVARRAAPSNGELQLLLTPRAAGLPGLRRRLLEEIEFRGSVPSGEYALPVDAAVDGTLNHVGSIHAPGEAVPLVTRLGSPDAARAVSETLPGEPLPPGWLASQTDESRTDGSSVAMVPTHILLDGIAHPISDRPIRVGTSPPEADRQIRLVGALAGISRLHCSIVRDGERVVVEDHSRHGSFLDERRVDRRAELAVGARLRLGSPGIELQLIRVQEDDGPAQD